MVPPLVQPSELFKQMRSPIKGRPAEQPVIMLNENSTALCGNYLAWLSCTAALERTDSRYRCGVVPEQVHGTCWADTQTGKCQYMDTSRQAHVEHKLLPIKPALASTPLARRLLQCHGKSDAVGRIKIQP